MKAPKLFAAVVLCLSIAGPAAAQNDTLIGYMDKSFKPVKDPEKADVFSVAVRRDSLWETIYVNASDNRRLVSCYFKDDYLTILHGLYQNYHEDGKTSHVRGWYNQGRRIGVWKSWFNSGELRDSVLYDQGEPAMIYQFAPREPYGKKISLTKDLKNGITRYFRYYGNGTLLEEYEKKGNETEQKFYFENGALRKHVKKRNERTIQETCYLETGEAAKKCIEPKKVNLQNLRPEFPGGQENFQVYLQNNFQLPRDFNTAINVGYTGRLSFMLSPKGKAYDIKILQSSHPDLDQPLRDLIQNMPLWNMKNFKEGYGPVVIPMSFNLNTFSNRDDPAARFFKG